MSKTIIKVENLGKKYSIGDKQKFYTLRDSITGIFDFNKKREPTNDFWALRDINFEVKQGESVGIIGRNGAGKSTLLKILSQITPPTTGKITLHGRVASLLEVGTGFHQELTGRENIFLNGAILGMSRAEIKRKFDEIVAFSEVEKFLDMPVKHYSSGMYMRLAFAVAAHLESEILIVDEVLAVGDAQFQKKCLGKMDEVAKKEGRTVLFVSHNMAAIRSLCVKSILLGNGKILFDGITDKCIQKYLGEIQETGGALIKLVKTESNYLEIKKVTINRSKDNFIRLKQGKTNVEVAFDIFVKHPTSLTIETKLLDNEGNSIAICAPGHLIDNGDVFHVENGFYKLYTKIVLPKLHKGTYYLEPRISDPGIQGHVVLPMGIRIEVDGWPTNTGRVFEKSLSGYGFQMIDGMVGLEKL